MKKTNILERLVAAYIAFHTAPRHSREADRLARRFTEARREALKWCEPYEIDHALGHAFRV